MYLGDKLNFYGTNLLVLKFPIGANKKHSRGSIALLKIMDCVFLFFPFFSPYASCSQIKICKFNDDETSFPSRFSLFYHFSKHIIEYWITSFIYKIKLFIFNCEMCLSTITRIKTHHRQWKKLSRKRWSPMSPPITTSCVLTRIRFGYCCGENKRNIKYCMRI